MENAQFQFASCKLLQASQSMVTLAVGRGHAMLAFVLMPSWPGPLFFRPTDRSSPTGWDAPDALMIEMSWSGGQSCLAHTVRRG